MLARLEYVLSLIAATLTVLMAALALGASIVALLLFVFLVYDLVFQIGLANWSSLGVSPLFLAIIGGIWLLGNAFLDTIAGVGFRTRQRAKITLPWLGIAAFFGLVSIIFAE